MQPSLPPIAALLCPAVLLLALLASPTTTISAMNNSNLACAPALCGNLSIAYPFWLAGTHPPECGYKAFQVTCEKGNSTLKNSLPYRILDIFYGNSSFRVTNDFLLDGTCDLELYSNASWDLGLGPFTISSRNLELFFLYDCDLGGRHAPRSWAHVNCDYESNSYVWLAPRRYRVENTRTPLPVNCTKSMMPALGYEGETGADYQRLLKRGSLLEYTDAGACQTCTETGGQCRVNASIDAFECRCSNGGGDWFISLTSHPAPLQSFPTASPLLSVEAAATCFAADPLLLSPTGCLAPACAGGISCLAMPPLCPPQPSGQPHLLRPSFCGHGSD